MKNFKIEIESLNDYDRKEEFNAILRMSSRDYLALVKVILDFVEEADNSAEIVLPEPKLKVVEAERPD